VVEHVNRYYTAAAIYTTLQQHCLYEHLSLYHRNIKFFIKGGNCNKSIGWL